MLSAADKKYLANLLSCGLIGQTAIDLINEKENNMRNQPKRENILFLAPSIDYARSVVKSLCHFLYRNEIPYNASPEHTAQYVVTDFASIDFMWGDPIDWKPSNFSNIDVVFGKKELVQLAREKFGCQCLIKTPNMCLDNYLINIVRKNTEFDNPDRPTAYIPAIKKVHFNPPMTVVIWEDGTKTIVKCQDGDDYSKETGLALCISKKAFGNKGNFNDIFKKWIPEEEETETVVDVFKGTIACSTVSEAVVDIDDKLCKVRDDIYEDLIGALNRAVKKNSKKRKKD
jgi:hypothetical protein